MLVEALQPERDLGHTPLFQVTFALQNAPMSELELDWVNCQPHCKHQKVQLPSLI